MDGEMDGSYQSPFLDERETGGRKRKADEEVPPSPSEKISAKRQRMDVTTSSKKSTALVVADQGHSGFIGGDLTALMYGDDSTSEDEDAGSGSKPDMTVGFLGGDLTKQMYGDSDDESEFMEDVEHTPSTSRRSPETAEGQQSIEDGSTAPVKLSDGSAADEPDMDIDTTPRADTKRKTITRDPGVAVRLAARDAVFESDMHDPVPVKIGKLLSIDDSTVFYQPVDKDEDSAVDPIPDESLDEEAALTRTNGKLHKSFKPDSVVSKAFWAAIEHSTFEIA